MGCTVVQHGYQFNAIKSAMGSVMYIIPYHQYWTPIV